MSGAPKKKAKTEAEVVDISEEEEIQNPQLEAIQHKIVELEEEKTEKIQQLEKEYENKKRPLIKERNKIVAEIPHFWLKAIMNHRLGALVTEEDQKVFEYLKEIEFEDLELTDKEFGYQLIFTFAPNPWFDNDKIIKTFKIRENGLDIQATTINWKEGKDLTAPPQQDESGNPKKRKMTESNTFFKYFQEEHFRNEDTFVAESFRDEFLADPIKYYYGLNDSEDEEEVDDEEEFDDEEQQEEDEGEEEEGGEEEEQNEEEQNEEEQAGENGEDEEEDAGEEDE